MRLGEFPNSDSHNNSLGFKFGSDAHDMQDNLSQIDEKEEILSSMQSLLRSNGLNGSDVV